MASVDIDSGKIVFDSRFNYQKIFIRDIANLSIADPLSKTTHTINHNLGYYPRVKVWFTNANGYLCEAVNDVATTYGVPGFTLTGSSYILYRYVYTDRVVITFDRVVTSGTTVNTTVYTRIYYDKAH